MSVPRRKPVLEGTRAARVEETVGGDAGLNRVRYRYRLLPRIIAARFGHWSRCSNDPAIRRDGRAVTVANVRFCDRVPKNGRWSGALIPDRGSSPPRMTTQGRVCCDFV